MAINPGVVSGDWPGNPTTDPAFGLPAIWIEEGIRDQAQALGYTVVDAGSVIATHLNHLISMHAAELLGRQEIQALLDHLNKEVPKLAEDLTPKSLPLTVVHKVLQNLLVEGVPIRDMFTIVEKLIELSTQSQDPNYLTSQVRIALGRSIVQQLAPGNTELPVMTLDTQLEKLLLQNLQTNSNSDAGLEPGLADTLVRQTAEATQIQEQLGHTPVLLVPHQLRSILAKFLRKTIPHLRVLSQAELPDNRSIIVTNLVGAFG
jgi:flagellar biosynthesis protein FlhA